MHARLFPFLILILATAPGLRAQREIPEPLKTWQQWATWDDKTQGAPRQFDNAAQRLPIWPSTLNLVVKADGAAFDLSVRAFTEAWLALPGDEDLWPQSVTLNDTPTVVVERDGKPAIKLPPGAQHRITGAFRWNEMPQRAAIPPGIGILTLTMNDAPVELPNWDANGWLWLKRTRAEEAEPEFLSATVYRVLEDGIPMWLNTEIELRVTGKSREEDLGHALPEGWKIVSVHSPIPAAVDDAGRIKAQVRAGKWTIGISAFRNTPPASIQYARDTTPIVAEEVIGFKARPAFRIIELRDLQAIDVSQTTFPAKWRTLPVYRWETSTAFNIEEKMRGMGFQKPEGLRIERRFWLDEDGRALTFRDNINGAAQQVWRLDAAKGQNLGAARMAGVGQLITRNPVTGASGIEIRKRDIQLEAVGRMDNATAFPATGWQADIHSCNASLNLPPGWRALTILGAEWSSGDWLTAWTLLDLFLLLVFTMAVMKLWGVLPAIVAFLAFGLAYHEPNAPRYLWFFLLVPLAILRVLPTGRTRMLVQAWKFLAVALLIINVVPFLGLQLQGALFPQLEQTRSRPIISVTQGIIQHLESSEIDSGQTARAVVAEPAAPDDASIINHKLDDIVLPRVEFRNATLMDAIDFLQAQSVSHDNLNLAGRKGVNFVLSLGDDQTRASVRLTLELANVPLREAVKYVSNLAGLRYKVEPHAVVFVPMTSNVRDAIPGSEAQAAPQRQEIDKLTATRPASSRSAKATLTSNLLYDVQTRIQTGPGVPTWSWRTINFGWRGPVAPTENVHLILIPPAIQRSITLVRVLMIILLIAILLGVNRLLPSFLRRTRPATLPGAAAALLAFTLLALSAPNSHAQLPSQEMLNKLRERLLEPADAFPRAAEIPSAALALGDREFTLEAEIHAAAECAVPLPGRVPSWSPVTVTIDNAPAQAVARRDGYLWVVLAPGIHRVTAKGLLANTTEWEWSFLLKPRHVTVEAPSWTVTGIKPNGQPENQVFFAIKAPAKSTEAAYDRRDYSPLVAIHRELEIGLVWQVRTTIQRLSPTGKAIALDIPLLPGERVITANPATASGAAQVRLGANDKSFSWESELPKTEKLPLAATASDRWTERWLLIASPVWNVNFTGIAPIYEPGEGTLDPVWTPWPGESVELTLTKPEAIPGATLTVRSIRHETTIGSRQRTGSLNLNLQASVGQDFSIGLDPVAEVTGLRIAGQQAPVRKDGAKIIVPVRPGDQEIVLDWKKAGAIGWETSVDALEMPVESSNIHTSLSVPLDRWLLWTDGPLRGPAVRLWVVAAFAIIGAFILGRLKLTPLGGGEWALLALGLTQIDPIASLLVIGWLFLLAWRGTDSFVVLRPILFNLLQLGLVFLAIPVAIVLVTILHRGLLGTPEIMVAGNGSSPSDLKWFSPLSDAALPQPRAFTISVWFYRLLMLAWALWLAFAALRWARWGWTQFSRQHIFKPMFQKLFKNPANAQANPRRSA